MCLLRVGLIHGEASSVIRKVLEYLLVHIYSYSLVFKFICNFSILEARK